MKHCGHCVKRQTPRPLPLVWHLQKTPVVLGPKIRQWHHSERGNLHICPSPANRNQSQTRCNGADPYKCLGCSNYRTAGEKLLVPNSGCFLPCRCGAQPHLKSHRILRLALSLRVIPMPVAPLPCPWATRATWKSLGRAPGLPRCTCAPSPSLLPPHTASPHPCRP